jgi:5-methylcytosine-specific restriction protein A
MARRSSAAGDRDHDDHTTGGRRPRRAQLIVITDVDALTGDLTGTAELDNGTLLPQSILQRWACDSTIGRVVMSGRSVPIDVGTVTYTATDGQRRALIARDRGCIIAGCKRKPRWCEAHHVVPFPHGPTNLDNLVLACKRHHKHINTGTLTLTRHTDNGRWTATPSHDTQQRQRPPPARAA